MSSLRAVVVGLGAMGSNHARVLSELPGVELVATLDTNPSRSFGPRLAKIVQLQSLSDIAAQQPDMAILATPTVLHAELGQALAEMRVPTLIEKPLADTSTEAARIVAAFEAAGVPACVGHIERFNPMVRELRMRVQRGDIGQPMRLHTIRHSPRPTRVRDVGVILDLATHDLDLGPWVLGEQYADLSAVVAGSPNHEDLVEVVARSASGAVISHSVGWLFMSKERELSVLGTHGLLRADLLTQELVQERLPTQESSWSALARLHGDREGQTVTHTFSKPEPLRVELQEFQNLVIGKPAETVTLEDGFRAVQLAECVKRLARGPSVRDDDMHRSLSKRGDEIT